MTGAGTIPVAASSTGQLAMTRAGPQASAHGPASVRDFRLRTIDGSRMGPDFTRVGCPLGAEDERAGWLRWDEQPQRRGWRKGVRSEGHGDELGVTDGAS